MVTLSMFSVGNGPDTTVLLHGLLGSGRNLRTLAARWGARDPSRKFVVPDLLGHGDSPPLPPEPSSRTLAAAVLETVDGLDGKSAPISLVGHSLGARVALAMAREDPECVREVILLDMTPGRLESRPLPTAAVLDVLLRAPDRSEDRRALRAFLTDAGLEPSVADWLLMNVCRRGSSYEWRIDRRAIAGLHDTIAREDLWPEVESRAFPLRCIRGERSPFVTETDAARMEAAGCRVVTLAGAGHYLHVDALDGLLDALAP